MLTGETMPDDPPMIRVSAASSPKAASAIVAPLPEAQPAPRLFSSPTPNDRVRPGVAHPGDASQQPAPEFLIRAVGSNNQTFQEFLLHSSDDAVAQIFTALCSELEALKLEDYHMKLANRFDHAAMRLLPGWEVVVIYKQLSEAADEEAGPLKVIFIENPRILTLFSIAAPQFIAAKQKNAKSVVPTPYCRLPL